MRGALVLFPVPKINQAPSGTLSERARKSVFNGLAAARRGLPRKWHPFAHMLYEIRFKKKYEDLGFQKYMDFLHALEVQQSINPTSVYELIDAYRVAAEVFSLTEEDMDRIRFTRLAIVAPVAHKDPDKWLAKVKDPGLTMAQLRAVARPELPHDAEVLLRGAFRLVPVDDEEWTKRPYMIRRGYVTELGINRASICEHPETQERFVEFV